MVKHPLKELERWVDVPQVQRVHTHIESADDIGHVITMIKKYGWEPSVTINPNTPITELEPHLEHIVSVMFMGVHPGKQGQPLVAETLERLATFHETYPEHRISLDGAVNEQTLPTIVPTGVDAVCPGSAIFHNERTPGENIERMRELINSLMKNV